VPPHLHSCTPHGRGAPVRLIPPTRQQRAPTPVPSSPLATPVAVGRRSSPRLPPYLPRLGLPSVASLASFPPHPVFVRPCRLISRFLCALSSSWILVASGGSQVPLIFTGSLGLAPPLTHCLVIFGGGISSSILDASLPLALSFSC
jgi:hypothetical protein